MQEAGASNEKENGLEKIVDAKYRVQSLDDIWRGQCNQSWGDLKYLTEYNLSHTDVATLVQNLSSDLSCNVIAFAVSRNQRKVYIYKPYIGVWELQTDESVHFNASINVIRQRLYKEVLKPLQYLIEVNRQMEPYSDGCSDNLSDNSTTTYTSNLKVLKSRLKLYKDLYQRLGDDTFKTKVINQLIKHYIHESAMMERTQDMFDQRVRCVGFNDGVYDFDTGELLKGSKAKEYYVTQTVGYSYSDVEGVSDEVYSAFVRFITQIMPDESVRQYFFKRLNKSLQRVVEKLVLILYNKTGDNGKTVLLNLIDKTFGDMYIKANNNLIKKEAHISASGPNEELMSLKGKSLACFSEASGTLNMSLLKEIIGGDKISTRGNHEKKQTFFSKALIVILCNGLPSPDAKEKATFKKLRCIPFEAEFVDNPLLVNEEKHKYLKDEQIEDNFEAWKYACMRYIIGLTHDEVEEPLKVVEHSRKYRDKEDVMYAFIQEAVEECPTGILRRVDLWNEWKLWSRDENTSMKKSEFNENVMDYMQCLGYRWYEDTKESGNRIKWCWRGCKMKEDSSNDEYG